MTELIGPLTFAIPLLIIYFLLPLSLFKKLLAPGIIWGFGVALILIYVMQNVFAFWYFQNIDILLINNIPIFLSATWIPLVMVFVYLLVIFPSKIGVVLLNILFPAGATLSHYIFISLNILSYSNWNLFYTFLVSLFIHLAITGYLYLFTHQKDFVYSQI